MAAQVINSFLLDAPLLADFYASDATNPFGVLMQLQKDLCIHPKLRWGSLACYLKLYIATIMEPLLFNSGLMVFRGHKNLK